MRLLRLAMRGKGAMARKDTVGLSLRGIRTE